MVAFLIQTALKHREWKTFSFLVGHSKVKNLSLCALDPTSDSETERAHNVTNRQGEVKEEQVLQRTSG